MICYVVTGAYFLVQMSRHNTNSLIDHSSDCLKIANDTASNYIDDNILMQIDQLLCSSDCPCYIYDNKTFYKNISVSGNYSFWNITNNKYSSISFQTCPNKTIQRINQTIMNMTNWPYSLNAFPYQYLSNYINLMQNYELNYKCSGYCQTNYVNSTVNNRVRTFYKFLFTNISQ